MQFLQFNPIKDKTPIFQKKGQKIFKKDEHIKFTIEYIDILKIYTTRNFT